VPDKLIGSAEDASTVPSADRLRRDYDLRDCSAVVVVEEATASLKRDIAILVVGAMFSLGVTLVVELGLALLRRARSA
jgi:hypothetical protein